MNTQKVLLGAVLVQPELAPYCLPGLEIEQFEPDLQPVFAAVSGFWETTGLLNIADLNKMVVVSPFPMNPKSALEWLENNLPNDVREAVS